MKILVVAFAYNEIQLLPSMVSYYKQQGCDIFILDNKSDDGTKEWLVENNVMHTTIDTGGMFHLLKLQAGLVKAINEFKPDWVVYTGIDIIYSFKESILKTIEKADEDGYNMIGVQYYNMYNTGEKYQLPLHENYFYGRKYSKLLMIAKYQEPFSFEADSIQIKGKKIFYADGVLINYGNCKPKAERIVTFLRRAKAWERGLDRNYGVHYLEGMDKGWIWTKEEMVDIRETQYYEFIQKIKI